jgi:hypothetical protein
MTTVIDLGIIRASNNDVIQLKVYDPYPNVGPKTYSSTANDMWEPFINYELGDWVVYYPGSFYYNGTWNATLNFPALTANQVDTLVNTQYIVNVAGTQDIGQGNTSFSIGDLIVYDGISWNRVPVNEHSYVCVSQHTSTSTFDPTKWQWTQLPPYFNLDPNSGVLYATLPYIPIYSKTYPFTLRVDKLDLSHNETVSSSQQFVITVRGAVDDPISFVSPQDLGTLTIGYLSELAVVATHKNADISTSYSIVSGELPPGLSLGIDGSIIGRITYGTTVGQYNFTIRATDLYQQIVEKNFYITAVDAPAPYGSEMFTQLYARPFLDRGTKYNYSAFISDPNIFERSMIYRAEDPNFGVQEEIRLYLEFGIQQALLSQYVDAMSQDFYNKKLWFGKVATAPANDEQGNYVYDMVYVEVVDRLQNSNGDYVQEVVIGNYTAYPNSINNMRNSLESIVMPLNTILVDEYQLPRYMRTIQSSTGLPSGYILAAPLCYTKPGYGATIVKRIEKNGFDFKTINFEIDRLIVENALSTTRPNYLIFPQSLGQLNNLNRGPAQ